jgi:hypothetical protein
VEGKGVWEIVTPSCSDNKRKKTRGTEYSRSKRVPTLGARVPNISPVVMRSNQDHLVFLLVSKTSEKGALLVPNSVDVIGKIFTTALDHLGTPNTVRALSRVLSEHYGTCAALLYGLKPDGSLQLVESFGFSETIQKEFESISLFDALPISDSIREGKIFRVSALELLEQYPHLSGLRLPQKVFYMVPCTSSGVPVGGLVVAFFTLKGEKLPNMVLQALQFAAFHVLSRRTDLVELV